MSHVVRRLRWLALILVLLPLGGRAQGADATARLIDELQTARSYKVRVQAAAVLARTGDPRATGALATAATRDPDPLVRTVAVELLAANPGVAGLAQARQALQTARGDKSPNVRRAAVRGLATLDATAPPASGTPVVAVRAVGDKTGRASDGLKKRMRAEILSNLRTTRSVSVTDAPNHPAAGFLVDASIARLDVSTGQRDAEVTLTVELIVSRPPRGIVTIASGEATVQKPRVLFRPENRARIEEEALVHAVRSAHENLNRFFASAGR